MPCRHVQLCLFDQVGSGGMLYGRVGVLYLAFCSLFALRLIFSLFVSPFVASAVTQTIFGIVKRSSGLPQLQMMLILIRSLHKEWPVLVLSTW